MANVTDKHGRPRSGQMAGLVEAIVIDNVDPDKPPKAIGLDWLCPWLEKNAVG